LHIRTLLAAGLASLAIASTASAAIINAPVPTSAYITVGGLDWAWANPIAGDDDIDLAFQGAFGWRLPTAAELANAPLATAFIKVGGNVPFNGTDPVSGATFASIFGGGYTGAGACASPYFSAFNYCDWADGAFGFWAGLPGYVSTDDQLYVRTTGFVNPTAPAPEPSTWAMLIAGFAALGVMLRRRRTIAA
jgi:hypothetical protein